MYRSILFKNLDDNTDMLEVKISEDFNNIVAANGGENYMLKKIIESNGKTSFEQTKISCLNNKIIRCILHGGTSEFIFICCNEYDKDLDIRTSMDEDFEIGIDR